MKVGPKVRTPDALCRGCGQHLNASSWASEVDGPPQPQEGDWDVCMGCGLVSVWEGGQRRAPTPEEQREAERSPIVSIVRAVIQSNRELGRKPIGKGPPH